MAFKTVPLLSETFSHITNSFEDIRVDRFKRDTLYTPIHPRRELCLSRLAASHPWLSYAAPPPPWRETFPIKRQRNIPLRLNTSSRKDIKVPLLLMNFPWWAFLAKRIHVTVTFGSGRKGVTRVVRCESSPRAFWPFPWKMFDGRDPRTACANGAISLGPFVQWEKRKLVGHWLQLSDYGRIEE